MSRRAERPIIERAVEVTDCEVSRSGDGRTVTAYAATFEDPYEVRDQHGHYVEELARSVFDRTISHGVGRIKVVANHARTVDGTPSERFSLPVGTPLEVRPDGKGLLTVTRYAKTPLGDELLELWGSGAITSQSFRGPIFRSAPPRPHSSGLPLVRRLELGLVEYGPAVFAVNPGAGLVSIRSQALAADPTSLLTVDPDDLSDEERQQLLSLLSGTGSEPPADPGVTDASAETSTPEPPANEAPAVVDSLDLLVLEQEQRRRRDSAA